LIDICDGRVWKEFTGPDGNWFFEDCEDIISIGLSLNVDWFRPYKHSQHSIGVIYLSVLNLPRGLRQQPENILLAGVIPGPKEPSMEAMNNYLGPLVDELVDLWSGVAFDGSRVKTLRAALVMVACDAPAARKVVGAVSFHAEKGGCIRCWKEFPRDSDNRSDFTGAELGRRRRMGKWYRDARKWLQAQTEAGISRLTLLFIFCISYYVYF